MRGGDRRSKAYSSRLYRCEQTGVIATAQEHARTLCAEFPRACLSTVRGNIYAHGSWWGRTFTEIGDPRPRTVSARMRALLEATPDRSFTDDELAEKLGVTRVGIQRAAGFLMRAGRAFRVPAYRSAKAEARHV